MTRYWFLNQWNQSPWQKSWFDWFHESFIFTSPRANYWFQIDSKFSLSTTYVLYLNWLRCSYLPQRKHVKRFTFLNTLLFRNFFVKTKNWNWHCICFCLHLILSFAKRIKSFQSMKRFLFSKSGDFCVKLAIISLQRSKSKQTSICVLSQFSSYSKINKYSFLALSILKNPIDVFDVRI